MSSPSLSSTLADVQHQLIRYVYSLWFILGIPGCILDIIIFSRPRLRKISCCNYFFAASVNNLATLAVGVGPVIYGLDHPDPLVQTLLFCKMRGYLFQICLMLSRWFVAFACIDRYAQSSSNVRLRNFASSRIACRSMIGIIIFWSIICTHRLIFYEIKGTLCGIITNTGAALYHTLYVVIGGGILPATIMIVCAFLIRRNLAGKRQRRQQQVITIDRTEHQRQQHSLDQQVLSLLFIQSCFYIVLTTPQVINLIYSTISSTIPNRSADLLAINGIIAFLAELMLYVFPVMSFYVYTLTARTFRQELIKLFRLLVIPGIRGRHHQIAPLNTVITIDTRIENQQILRRLSKIQTVKSPNICADVIQVPLRTDDEQIIPTTNEFPQPAKTLRFRIAEEA